MKHGHGRGLTNGGNQCYKIAALQALAHVQPFASFFRELTTENWKVTTKGALADAFETITRELFQTTSDDPVNSKPFCDVLGIYKAQFNKGDQQDSQEAMLFMIEILCKELVLATPLEESDDDWARSVPGALFTCQLQTIHLCHGSYTSVFEHMLSVPLPHRRDGTLSLMDCMALFLAEETLEVDCDLCQGKKKKRKQVGKVLRFPPYLIVHLKRFQRGSDSKLCNMVDWSGLYDFKQFASDLVIRPASCVYRACGVVHHSGSTLNEGHYYTDVVVTPGDFKSQETTTYFRYNDSTVAEAPDPKVDTEGMKTAYIIILSREDAWGRDFKDIFNAPGSGNGSRDADPLVFPTSKERHACDISGTTISVIPDADDVDSEFSGLGGFAHLRGRDRNDDDESFGTPSISESCDGDRGGGDTTSEFIGFYPYKHFKLPPTFFLRGQNWKELVKKKRPTWAMNDWMKLEKVAVDVLHKMKLSDKMDSLPGSVTNFKKELNLDYDLNRLVLREFLQNQTAYR